MTTTPQQDTCVVCFSVPAASTALMAYPCLHFFCEACLKTSAYCSACKVPIGSYIKKPSSEVYEDLTNNKRMRKEAEDKLYEEAVARSTAKRKAEKEQQEKRDKQKENRNL